MLHNPLKHLGKGKTIGTKTRSVLSRGWGEESVACKGPAERIMGQLYALTAVVVEYPEYFYQKASNWQNF